MSDDDYNKCKSCRFCAHAEDKWLCYFNGEDKGSEGTCNKYRPGICETCSFYRNRNGTEICNLNSQETFGLDVCSMYDPGYSR